MPISPAGCVLQSPVGSAHPPQSGPPSPPHGCPASGSSSSVSGLAHQGHPRPLASSWKLQIAKGVGLGSWARNCWGRVVHPGQESCMGSAGPWGREGSCGRASISSPQGGWGGKTSALSKSGYAAWGPRPPQAEGGLCSTVKAGDMYDGTPHMRAKALSCVRLFATTWTIACQAPLSMEFSKQEY